MNQIGIIGMAVMGKNLARNFASKNISVSVYNRTYERTAELIKEHGSKKLQGFKTLEQFVQSLHKPRKIIILVQAGPAVDAVITSLIPLLDQKDFIIDMGNSFYKDTERRFQTLNLNYLGCGLSGGEVGALNGPSLMPGGPKQTWKMLKPLLEPISAYDFQGHPCVSYLGKGSAGHYVKMAHNGIEYALIQMLAETYDLLKKVGQMKMPQIHAAFEKFNHGLLNSYLLDLSTIITAHKDEKTGKWLLEKILDQAGQKGTGTWTAIEGIEKAVAIPSITSAVFARTISSKKKQRQNLASIYQKINSTSTKSITGNHTKLATLLKNALHAGTIISFAEGLNLIQEASTIHQWNTNLSEVVRIWQGGCIIRTKLLQTMQLEFQKKPGAQLFSLPTIAQHLQKTVPNLAKVVSLAAQNQVHVPTFSAALNYFYGTTQANGSTNFIQALRDAFGAHTYQRTDKPGSFHTEWST